MAVIEVTCPNPACRAKLKAPAERIGKKAKCNKCRELFRIPGPIPPADTAGDAQLLSAVETAVPMASAVDDEDDRTELIAMDDVPPPAPKAKPVPKALADLPSADPFDFQKPGAASAKPAHGGAAKDAPATAPPAVKPPAPKIAPPAAKPATGAPVATAVPAPKVKSGARPALPVEPLPFDDDPEPPKSKPASKKAEPKPEPADDNPFAFADGPKDKKPESRERDQNESEALPRKKKPGGAGEAAEPPKKAKSKSGAVEDIPEPVPARDAASAFGFNDEPEPDAPKKAKRRPSDADEPTTRTKKTRDDKDNEEGAEDKPRYKRPQSGMGKALLISGAAALVALALVAAVVVTYIRVNRVEEVKKEEKKEEPPAPVAPPPVTPPVAAPAAPPVPPKEKSDPKKPSSPDPKPKAKEKEKEPVAPARPPVELAGKFKSFTLGKEPAKFQASDRYAEPRFVVETPFASLVRAFPPANAKSLDTYLVTRVETRFSFDAYSPSSGKRVSRLEFPADPKPLCDVLADEKESRFLAVAAGRVTVWNVADQKKLFDAFDPYADKPEHAKNGLAAVFFAPQPDQIVTVSTAGAVHLFDLTTKEAVGEFVPPHGSKGAVAFGEAVARADAGSIALAVGGIVYQIKMDLGLERARTHDLGGDVKALALAANGAPGRLVFAFEAEAKGKKTKDRALLYMPVGDAKPGITLWPATAGTPKSAFWVHDTEAGIVTERGVVWFGEEENKFEPVVVTKPATDGLYTGSGTLFWYAVPHPSKPAESVLVPLSVPFGDAAQFRGAGGSKPLQIVRIDQNGLAK